MKGLILGAVLTAAALLLSSCSMVESRLAELNRSHKSETELINTRYEQIFKAIENRDKDALKAMFSEEALTEAEELDDAIEYLIDSFPVGIDSWKASQRQTSENLNRGERNKSIGSHCDVFVGDTHYSFSIMDRTIDTENPEKVGLFSMIVEDDGAERWGVYTAGIHIAIGDRIIPQPPKKEDPYANEEVFEMYDLIFTVPAGLERQTFAGVERSVSVYFESDDGDSPASSISVSPTRSSWDGSNGAVALETDSDGAPILTPQSVISQYMVEPEVTAVFDTGTLIVCGKPAAYIEVELITGTDSSLVLKARLTRVIYDGIAYDFFYSALPECYDEYLKAAQGIIDSAQFKLET